MTIYSPLFYQMYMLVCISAHNRANACISSAIIGENDPIIFDQDLSQFTPDSINSFIA